MFRALRLCASAALLQSPGFAATSAEGLAAERARPVPPLLPREAFSVRPEVESVTLAPDGRHLAWIRIAGDRRSLWVLSTAAGASSHALLRRIDADRLIWSRDSRWLYLVSGTAVRRLAMAGQAGSGLVATLGGAAGSAFVGLDPWRPAALLVDEIRTAAGHTRYRLWRTAEGGKRTLLAHGGNRIVDAAIDRAGHAAFVKLAAGDHHVILARRANGGFGVLTRCARLERCGLLGVAPDGGGLLMAGDPTAGAVPGDRGLRAVIRIDADGRRTLIHIDPARRADLDTVVPDRLNGIPAIAGYRGAVPSVHGLTPDARHGLARLASSLSSGDVGIEVSAGPWLVRERDARLQGARWRLFDPRNGTMRTVLDDPASRLPPELLARALPLSWRASDGMELHGLLTVPPGRDPARVPLIVIVHGGPWSRDYPDYDALTQLLANRGFAVLRPQFRGSTGYGRAYTRAAAGDFGDGRVQRDIQEGTRHALALGVGDRRRVAIMGASFGGYATLQALSNGSRLYRMGVALVPPVDFGWTARWAVLRGAVPDAEGIALEQSMRMLGLDVHDPRIARRLRDQSPRARIAAMRSPLLILAAGRDERVPIRSVIDYAAHLRVIGAGARIVVARRQPHSSDDPRLQAASLYLIEDMLRRHLSGRAAARPDSVLRGWMAANMDVM